MLILDIMVGVSVAFHADFNSHFSKYKQDWALLLTDPQPLWVHLYIYAAKDSS